MSHGKIYPPSSMFLRVEVGEAKDEHGNQYKLSTNAAGAEPIVHCVTTGKWFVLGWKDIITLAVDAGIHTKAKGIEEELAEIQALEKPWSTLFGPGHPYSREAVAVFSAICSTASDFKGNLDSVADEHLELLIEPCANSAVKTKLIASRLRRRDQSK